jgi:hypothetical protein
MRVTRNQLRQLIREEVSRITEWRANVSQMDAQKIFSSLSTRGRNRDLGYGDLMDADNFIRANVVRWQTTREAKLDMIDWLVSKRFGNLVDYR